MRGGKDVEAVPTESTTKSKLANPYDRIKHAIMTGELQPGEALVETALAQWCGVSRTPIREALTRLEQDGLVQRGDRGLIVRASSQEEILDIYDVRVVLESRAAAIAADRRTSHDILAMRSACERHEQSEGEAPSVLAETNRRFHRTIWRASRNESLIDLLSRLDMHLGRYPETTLSYPGRLAGALDEHRRLVEAIEARDADLASKIAAKHFTEALNVRLRLWDSEQ